MEDRQQLFGAVLGSIQDELDWERLGRAYCEGDGSSFFDDESRERWLDSGLLIADELARHLSRVRGRSVYIGAALAEIPVMLVERLVLGREVAWLNLPSDELLELERVLHLVGAQSGVELPLPSTASIDSLPRGDFDHVWLVSVLTDPEHFPALHDELYERHGTVLGTGRGTLAAERARAERLAGAALDLAADGALLTTSEEELAVLLPLARARDRVLRPLDRHRRGPRLVSGIVGDVVRCLRLGSRDAPPEA